MSAAFLLLAFPGRMSAADSFTEAARELAGKIQTGLGPIKKVAFTFQSLSSLGASDLEAARQSLENEMRTRGIRFGLDSQTMATINVTLSENLQQYIWVAEIKRGQSSNLVMTAQERLPNTPIRDVALYMTIQTKLIFEQEGPILDLKLLDEELLVLTPGAVALYRRDDDKWELEHSFPLKSLRPMPRDVRGRLSDAGNDLQINLPGLFCKGTARPAFAFECSQEEMPWPFPSGSSNLAAAANYFVQENLPPFFSIVGVKDEGVELWVVAGADGRTYLYDSAFIRIDAIDDGWGSEIAAIESECGTKRQLLVALRTDPLERGAIQAFEIINRKAVVRSSAVEFSGPITALWPVSKRNAAIAISRDQKTGHYAAFYLSISCSR